MHLLQPMNLTVNISKCLLGDDPRLPKMKVHGALPSVMLNINDEQLLNIISLISSIPLPEGDTEPGPIKRTLSKSSSIFSMEPKDLTVPREPSKSIKEPIDDNFLQFTNLVATFVMKEFVVTLSGKPSIESGESLVKLLSFNVLNLEFDLTQQTYNMTVGIKLGGIGLKHYFGRSTLDVITTPMTVGDSEYLLCFDYTQVKKSFIFY